MREILMISVNLFSELPGEVNKFLSRFYNTDLELKENLNWQKQYANPVEMAEIIGTYVDNFDDFILTMWISLDKGVYIHVTDENANDIIKYLYERFPY